MKFKCPKCQKTLTVKDEFAGRRGRCPACKAVIVAPELSQDSHNNAEAPQDSLASAPSSPTSQPPLSSPSASVPQTSERPETPPELPNPATAPKTVPVPPPLPSESDVSFALPTTFWGKLVYCLENERKELVGLIIGAAVIGLAAGYWWGGLYDPWGGQKKAFTAVLNLVLFGGWGAAEVLGLLIARNFKLAKRQGSLLLASAIAGGLWVGLWSAVDMATEPLEGLPVPVNVTIGFLAGVLIGGGISVISTLKASKIMFIPGEIIAHTPVRRVQRTAAGTTTSSSGWKIALWVGGGCLVALIIGGAIVGVLVYKTMDTFKEFQEEFEAERLTIEPVIPIPYASSPAEANLISNGTFQNLEGWKTYEQILPEDTASITTGTNYVVWARTNSREESGALGVYQDDLHVDLNSAGQVLLDLDVWVGGQTLVGDGEWTESAGITGEMPVHVEITYLDENGEKFLWDRGFLIYGFGVAANVEVIDKATWTHVTVDLLDDEVRTNPKGDLLPPPVTITKIMVYGNGWDFSGAVGNLSIQSISESESISIQERSE